MHILEGPPCQELHEVSLEHHRWGVGFVGLRRGRRSRIRRLEALGMPEHLQVCLSGDQLGVSARACPQARGAASSSLPNLARAEKLLAMPHAQHPLLQALVALLRGNVLHCQGHSNWVPWATGDRFFICPLFSATTRRFVGTLFGGGGSGALPISGLGDHHGCRSSAHPRSRGVHSAHHPRRQRP